MSAIEPGELIIEDHKSGDKIDITFDIENVDLTGLTLKCECKVTPDSEPALVFLESDGSLAKVVKSATLTTVLLIKTAPAMAIPPNLYGLYIIAYSSTTDVNTIVEGSLEIVKRK